MMTRDAKRRLVTIGVFLLPVVLVKVVAAPMGHRGPAAAEASNTPTPVVAIPHVTVAPQWSEQQRAAAQHVVHLRTQPFGPTPLYYDPPQPPPDRSGSSNTLGHVTVQMIMSTASGDLALINGKRYRTGDRLRDAGWIVSEINASSGSVTFKHPASDRSVVVSVRGGR
ncbi:MAG: hypothetical protein O7C65_07800 [Planctomycetota bacterium]|nr:hypothetical protein [Planctomycetota bacterium]